MEYLPNNMQLKVDVLYTLYYIFFLPIHIYTVYHLCLVGDFGDSQMFLDCIAHVYH